MKHEVTGRAEERKRMIELATATYGVPKSDTEEDSNGKEVESEQHQFFFRGLVGLQDALSGLGVTWLMRGLRIQGCMIREGRQEPEERGEQVENQYCNIDPFA